MSDQSIAAIARSLAAALLAEGRARTLMAEVEALKKRGADDAAPEVAALEHELCAEYRAEIVETLKV
jgi:hypothetical protein